MENMLSTYDDEEMTFIVCDVCNIKIRSDAIYRIHLTTIQHLKREEALVAAGKARKQQPLPVWNSYTDYLDYLQLDEPIVGLKHLVELDTPPGPLGSRYHCRLCHYEADMPDMTKHVLGRKHRQKYLETQRPDLVTWDKSTSSQPGKVVRAKAEVAERQDGRGVPERLKQRPRALGKIGALKVLSTQPRGRQPLAQGHRGGPVDKPLPTLLSLCGPAHHRSNPREESYGQGFPELHLPVTFASAAEWRAEQPRRRSLEKEEGFYPHGHAQNLPADSYPAFDYGDGIYPQRADYEEGRGGGAYDDKPTTGRIYEVEGRRSRVYEAEGRRGGIYEREGRRGGVYEGESGRADVISHGELGGGERVSSRDRDTGSFQQDVEGINWQRGPPTWEGPIAVNELPETFRRFLSGAGKKRRVSRFSQDTEPSRETGLDSKKLKLDPMKLGKVDYMGKDFESSDVLDDLKTIDIESVEEANFIKEKLCSLLKEFQANKSQREQTRRKSPSGFYRDYKHLSTQQQGLSSDLSHVIDPFLDPRVHYTEDQIVSQDRYERSQRVSQDHYERSQRVSQDHYERGERDSQDHFLRGERDPQDHYLRGQRDLQDHFERDQGGLPDKYKRAQREPQDHFERGSLDSQHRYERGQRDSQHHYVRNPSESQDRNERGRRNSQHRYVRGQSNSQDRYERGSRDSQDRNERGQKDSQHHYERSWSDSQHRFKRGQRDSEDRYDPVPRGSRERSDREEGRVDSGVAHRHSSEDVWSPHRRLDRVQPSMDFESDLPPALLQQGYSSPENSASLEKITSTLLQLVARRRPL